MLRNAYNAIGKELRSNNKIKEQEMKKKSTEQRKKEEGDYCITTFILTDSAGLRECWTVRVPENRLGRLADAVHIIVLNKLSQLIIKHTFKRYICSAVRGIYFS